MEGWHGSSLGVLVGVSSSCPACHDPDQPRPCAARANGTSSLQNNVVMIESIQTNFLALFLAPVVKHATNSTSLSPSCGSSGHGPQQYPLRGMHVRLAKSVNGASISLEARASRATSLWEKASTFSPTPSFRHAYFYFPFPSAG